MTEQVEQALRRVPAFRELLAKVLEGGAQTVHGVAGSMVGLLVGAVHDETTRPVLVVARDRDSAEKTRDDLAAVLPHQGLAYFPGDHARGEDHPNDTADLQALRAMASGEAHVVVTHPHALTMLVPPPEIVRTSALSIESGSQWNLATLRARLDGFGFERHDFVDAAGQYALRGGIVDVYPFTGDNPVRIELFGDTVESLRQFDPLSQRSIKDLSIAVIVPDVFHLNQGEDGEPGTSLAAYLPDTTILVLDEPEIIRGTLEHPTAGHESPVSFETALAPFAHYSQLRLTAFGAPGGVGTDFHGVQQPSFNGSIVLFHRHLLELTAQGYLIVVTCDGHGELARLKDLLLNANESAEDRAGEAPPTLDLQAMHFTLEALHAGFLLAEERLALFTEHQVFGRVKRKNRQRTPKFKGFSQKELQQLRRGDFVVHRDYGIGRFVGLKKIRVRNADQEVVSVQYEGNDMLYVNLNYINRLQKYSSKEGHVPRLNRLGSNEWDRLKARVKSKVKDIARDLIRLYARRKHLMGMAFPRDTAWQKEMEASFMYEDTLDQAKATREVKEDMEAPNPMDRLICGDVGFGKTEVAIRAAFKAVSGGRQVAVLVPTTILAVQHYHTFSDRLGRYGVNVQVLSRFKQRKEQLRIIDDLRSGATDIVIGTHRLLSKDVQLKKLGLLIIDEEHRFGVSAKEKLRMLRAEVDTLSLTATPIPRTLHFSLMGARDLSIIATPPRNRLPIATEIVQWSDELIREAVMRELGRGGQVYVVHDRVQNIDELAARLQEVLPGVRLRIAHGQMNSTELETTMVDFLERRFDVLLATKIIESGLDIPSVNTIIVNRADRFGMAELYQLRGRVGRSNVQAYALLITPPVSILPRATLQRLQALEEFTELGSGFNLAMRDLEIRGAGNLLGSEQSGFIETMGFETYTRILEEAVQELKEEEFQELFASEEKVEKKTDVVVEADVDAFIPDGYVANDAERLAVYRRLYAAATEDQVREAADELRDRFGGIPQEVEQLLGVVRLRLLAGRLGFAKLRLQAGSVEADFPPDTQRTFYESEDFQLLMAAISKLKGKKAGLRQEGPLLTYFHFLPSLGDQGSLIAEAMRVLSNLLHARESLRTPVSAEK